MTTTAADNLVQEFLDATEAGREAALLEALLSEHVEPLVRAVVWRRLGSSAPVQDREDTAGEAMVELVGRLQSLRSGKSGRIGNFLGYAAVTTHHCCDHYLRARFPLRHRLKARLRYLLANAPEYALWESAAGEAVCGREADRGAAPESPPDDGWFHSVTVAPGASEAEILAAVFSERGAPLLLDDLVQAVSHLTGLGGEAPAAWDDTEQRLASATPDYSERLDQQRALAAVWAEIRELPRPQRVALLLHLRDDHGSSVLPALVASGVASLRHIAAVLEWEAGELARMWRDLPLSDLEIASRLGLQRQQVINLRKSARERLGRRLAGTHPGRKATGTGGNIRSISTSNKTEG